MDTKDFHIFSIAEITSYIKDRLTSDSRLLDIWILGEISNFVHHSSGHFYFTLKDENSQLPCAMFRWANEKLEYSLKNGMQIIARGSIDVYKPQGRYNFIVSQVLPKGPGELYLKFLALKEKLAAEGLFDVKFKKPIPKFPERIGIVTSPTGAAIQDILNIIKRRFSPAQMIVAPALVQGENAAKDIANAINLLNNYREVDVLIVGRGGGSIEDLWPFNEEIVARAIFESKIPVISAVGHETDFTISDFTADLRAPTPSAAAELAVPDKNEVLRYIQNLKNSLSRNLKVVLEINRSKLNAVALRIRPRLVEDRIVQFQQATDDLLSKVVMVIEHQLDMHAGRFGALSQMLGAVSPMATLSRGYSITQKIPEKTTIDSIEKVDIGDDVMIIVTDGKMKCEVRDKNRDHGMDSGSSRGSSKDTVEEKED